MTATVAGLTPANVEEQVLLAPLIEMLMRRRWIGPSTRVAREFSWGGNRVDLATLTSSGVAGAYELKVGSFARALHQASLNRLAFDRSWVVVDRIPKDESLNAASTAGIGVIVVSETGAQVMRTPVSAGLVSTGVRAKLRRELRKRGSHLV